MYQTVQVILFIIMILMAPSIIADYLPVEGDISYQLDWDLNGAELTSDGWQITTDLGYEVVIHEGYITSFNASLISCSHSHGLFGWLVEMLSPGEVQAGHGGTDDEPSIVNASVVESLTAPSSTVMGTVHVTEPNYCNGFYVLGQAHDLAANLPDDFDMTGNSLYIRGEYIANDGTATPFTVTTNVGWGTQDDLTLPQSDRNIHVAVGNEAITISIQRSLATLFDGIDFETADEITLSHSLLRNLTDNTCFIVLTGKTHS